MLAPGWRDAALERLSDGFDLVVVGAGITGSGILLDASQRGLRTLLVEAGDVASGTSSRSSKLVHGGLRYLKQMQFRVTRQACRERDRMIALNPHLVQPVRFVYPVYKGDALPGWKVDLGLWMYDRLTTSPRRRSHLDAEELERLVPGIPTVDMDRTLSYFDGCTDDARLTLAVAATGVAHGGLLLTRAPVEDGIRDPSGRLVGVRLRDLETGRVHEVRSRLVVNATGVWVDELRHRLGEKGDRVRPSRGSHLVFARDRVRLGAALTIPAPDDGRPVFFIPHTDGVLAGTTDLFHDGSLDDPRPTADEVAYLLRAAQSAFPEAGLERQDIRGAFAGLRPILDVDADDPSAASREEAIWVEQGLVSVAGGKLTTWRWMAEAVVDKTLELLPEEVQATASPCATAGTPLGHPVAADLPERLHHHAGVAPGVARAMAARLGGLAWTATCLARRASDLHPLVEGSDLCAAELRAHLRFGGVLHLDDLLLRRVRAGMWQPSLAGRLLEASRPLFRSELGWRYRRWNRELDRWASAASGWTLEGVA